MARKRVLAAQHPAVAAARRKAPRLRRALLKWWRENRRSYPWREETRTTYEVLVAEMLLKRTTATAAARVYDQFLRRFPSVGALNRARQATVEKALVTVGLQRQRAKGFKEMARYLIDVEGGAVPSDIERLARVPYVGSYAAAAVGSFALDVPAAVVDSNVERIVRRVFKRELGSSSGSSVSRDVARRLLPGTDHRDFNLALLDFAAAVCRYGRPRCEECPVRDVCDYGGEIGIDP